jgi:DNA (cytosine-5)-methyltransferase 1
MITYYLCKDCNLKRRRSKINLREYPDLKRSRSKIDSLHQHVQIVNSAFFEEGSDAVVSKKSDFPVKTLVSTYHKIQRLTGTFVSDGPTGLRLLTANECKAIMGFPKSFKIPVSRTQMYRQLGNSVALPVVTAVAKEILATMVSDVS